nr:sex-lethal homolog [Arachis hypogaea]
MGDREAERGGYTRGGGSRDFFQRRKDPRIWTKEEYHHLERDSFTVFVDNLPEDISRRELYQMFCWTGRINDIYLCRKQKTEKAYIFAFVRYTTKGGALKAIAEKIQATR